MDKDEDVPTIINVWTKYGELKVIWELRKCTKHKLEAHLSLN